MSDYTVIYHAGCNDGFGAAWICRGELEDKEDVEYVPAHYKGAPPDVTGREVYIVDFSYPRDVLIEMARTAASIVVLDHHKTAREALSGVDAELHCPAHVIFDMEHSGAMLTWQHFHGNAEPPELIRYVQDRDLWRFELPDSKAVTAWLSSWTHNFEVWDQLAALLDEGPANARREGRAILRAQEQQIEHLCRHPRRQAIDGHDVPTVNSPVYMSEIGHILAKGELFSGVWYEQEDGRKKWSLRSEPGGLDVSEVAKALGGGGHEHAAGFVEEAPAGVTTSNKLANYIMHEIPGEPSQDEGADDCAVRLLLHYREAMRAAMHELSIPGGGYPARVANAYGLLRDALRKKVQELKADV